MPVLRLSYSSGDDVPPCYLLTQIKMKAQGWCKDHSQKARLLKLYFVIIFTLLANHSHEPYKIFRLYLRQ